MNPVLERTAKQFTIALKQSCEQQHRVLNVGHCVSARVFLRKHSTCLLRGKVLVGKSQQQWPLALWNKARHQGVGSSAHTRHRDSAHPAGSSIIRVLLAA